jgi:predicted lipoprotein with Yx(FWY)xxD motif
MRRSVAALAALLAASALGGCASTDAMTAGSTKIVVGKSQYGTMLFNARHQAIYVFGRDRRGKSNCYGQCAALWPPVYTSGRPRAGAGIRTSLLGTIRRRGGRLQVTYAGRPLYYYVHEGPGQVRCHDVNLSGGIWKVVAPDGHPRR